MRCVASGFVEWWRAVIGARRRVVAALAVFTLAPVAAVAQEQSSPDVGGRATDAAAQLLSIIGLVATPDITASRIDVEGDGALSSQRIDSLRLANDTTLDLDWGRLYLEGNLGFARADIDLRLPDRIVGDVNVDAIGAFGGAGPEFEVARFTRVRPLAIVGVGYVDDSLDVFDIDDTEPTDLALRQWAAAYGFGVGVQYERPFGGDLLDLRLKASQVWLQTVRSEDDRFTGNTSNQTINASAVYKYDTGIRFSENRLLLTGLLGGNAFLGDQQDALGFSWFAEYGGGLELDISPSGYWVQRARFRVTGIAGDGVTGISVGVGIGF